MIKFNAKLEYVLIEIILLLLNWNKLSYIDLEALTFESCKIVMCRLKKQATKHNYDN